jgi:hypothetical protein
MPRYYPTFTWHANAGTTLQDACQIVELHRESTKTSIRNRLGAMFGRLSIFSILAQVIGGCHFGSVAGWAFYDSGKFWLVTSPKCTLLSVKVEWMGKLGRGEDVG